MGHQWDGSAEEDGIDEYRPISILGIIALLLGMVSIFAVYIPAVGLVGVLAILLGILAVVQGMRQPTSLVGTAYVGVFIAVFSITFSQVARSSYDARLLQTASEHGQRWLQLIADGEVNQAICLRMNYLDRPLEGTDLDEYFKRTERPSSSHSMMPPPKELKKMFTDKRTVKNLIISGEKTKLRPLHEKDRFLGFDTGVAKIITGYEADVMLAGKMETLELEVQIYRIKFPTHVQWQVKEITNLTHPDTPTTGPQLLDQGTDSSTEQPGDASTEG